MVFVGHQGGITSFCIYPYDDAIKHGEAVFTEKVSRTCAILSTRYEIFEWVEKQKGGNIARVQVRFTLQHLAFEQVEHLQNSGTDYRMECRADSLAEVHLRQPSSDKRQTLSEID